MCGGLSWEKKEKQIQDKELKLVKEARPSGFYFEATVRKEQRRGYSTQAKN